MLNLCFNAIQALEGREEGRWVRVSTRRLRYEVELCISDGGPGIAARKTTQPAVPALQSTKLTGFGSGLAIPPHTPYGLECLHRGRSADAGLAGVGPRGTHGAILDFCKKLVAHPEYLDVLGDGRQAKPYLHVSDCVAGLLFVLDHAAGQKPAIYNLAPPDITSVRRIAELCVAASPNKGARIEYGSGAQGWPGDVPRSLIKPDKLAALGFRVRHTSDAAVAMAVTEVAREVFGA